MKQLLCLAEHHKVTALLRIAPPMCLALRSSAIPTDVLRDAIHITTADGRIAVTLWNWIREVPASKFGQDSGYPDRFYCYQQYSHNQHIHLRHIIRLPVSAQRAIIRPMTENYENQTPYIWQEGITFYAYNCKKGGVLPHIKCMEFDFHNFLSWAWWWLFELKPVAWSHATSVCFCCDSTTDKSKIYFCMYIPTGMSNIKIILIDVSRGFLQSIKADPEIYLGLEHDCFPSNPFSFILHQPPYHSEPLNTPHKKEPSSSTSAFKISFRLDAT
jgi:hypothetical protein